MIDLSNPYLQAAIFGVLTSTVTFWLGYHAGWNGYRVRHGR